MLLDLFRDTIGKIEFDNTGFSVERRARLWDRTSSYHVAWSDVTDVWALREVGHEGSTVFLRILAGDQDVTISDREAGWLELARELPHRIEGFPSLRGWLPRIYSKPRAHTAIAIYQSPNKIVHFPKTAAAHA